MKPNNAIIVGKFQFPHFPSKLKKQIELIIEEFDEVCFVVQRSYCKATLEEPLSFEMCAGMIQQTFGEGFLFRKIPDHRSHKEWSFRLDIIAQNSFQNEGEVKIFAEEDTPNYYLGKSSLIHLSKPSDFDPAAEIGVATGVRLGAFHVAQSVFNNPMPVVDMAVIDEPNDRILLGRKEGEEKYRFFGGFAENHTESYEEDALRELSEECGLSGSNLGTPRYVTSALIDDWRYRTSVRKMKSLFFVVPYLGGTPQAGDDIKEVKFFSLKNLLTDPESILLESHVKLIKHLTK